MSRLLSELLGAREPWFSINIAQLERASGYSATDVRLTADILSKAHTHIRAFDLMSDQIDGQQIYNSLIGLVELHDKFLVNHLGGNDSSDVDELVPKVRRLVEKLNIPKQAWVIKHSVAKRLLKAHPPKQVMKLLKYRSIDSMLKRESMGVLYGAIRFVESEQWLKQFMLQYRHLQPSDFETRPIELIELSGDKWAELSLEYVNDHHFNLIHSKELGAILIMPIPIKRLNGISVTMLTLLLHYINEIRLYSSFLKYKQVEPDFGNIVLKSIADDETGRIKIASHPIHWRVIQRHYAGQARTSHPEFFEPYLLAEDLTWRRAEEVLYRLEPALMYWHDMDYVGAIFDGRIISFNIMDNAVNYLNNVEYGKHTNHHMRLSLWNEIQMRYLGHRPIEMQVLKQLEISNQAVGVMPEEMLI